MCGASGDGPMSGPQVKDLITCQAAPAQEEGGTRSKQVLPQYCAVALSLSIVKV